MAQDSRGIVKEESLKNKLNGETGEGKTEVSDIGEEFEVLFIDSNRYYTVDNVFSPLYRISLSLILKEIHILF